MWELKRVLYFGTVSVLVPFPRKFCLTKPLGICIGIGVGIGVGQCKHTIRESEKNQDYVSIHFFQCKFVNCER